MSILKPVQGMFLTFWLEHDLKGKWVMLVDGQKIRQIAIENNCMC